MERREDKRSCLYVGFFHVFVYDDGHDTVIFYGKRQEASMAFYDEME